MSADDGYLDGLLLLDEDDPVTTFADTPESVEYPPPRPAPLPQRPRLFHPDSRLVARLKARAARKVGVR